MNTHPAWQEWVTQIRAIPIEHVLEYFGAKRRGRSWCCPFHDDRTPSSSVKYNRLQCFACGQSWSTIDLIMQKLGLDFIRAAQYLADLHGIPKPQEDPVSVAKWRKRYDRAKAEAERLVTWKHGLMERARDERNHWLGVYHHSKNFVLHNRAEECERRGDLRYEAAMDAGVRAWREFERLDEAIDTLTTASFGRLLPLYRQGEAQRAA